MQFIFSSKNKCSKIVLYSQPDFIQCVNIIVDLNLETTTPSVTIGSPAKKEIEDNDLSEDEAACTRFATVDKVKQLSVTARIWEEV